jgi:peptidoglycan/LPS O-acetylase OafA/YrhL
MLVVTSLIVIVLAIGATLLFINENSLGTASLMFGLVIFIGLMTVFLKKSYQDMKAGIPAQDERSKKVRLYAAGYSFFFSLYLWLALLMFQKYFDHDDILITGLLGMGIIFGVSWIIVNKKKGLE